MQHHGSKYFARRSTPHNPRDGVNRSAFSEHGHVAYQDEENHECSNKAVNILPTYPFNPTPPPPGYIWSIGQNSTFSDHDYVAYQIKGDTHAAAF